MALFGGSDSRNAASSADQGNQAQDKATATNINLSAGDDQSATVNVHRTEDNSIHQVDNSDNSIRNIDNSDNSVYQVDQSMVDNSVYQVDESDRSDRRVNNSRVYNTQHTTNIQHVTDHGAVSGSLTLADRTVSGVLDLATDNQTLVEEVVLRTIDNQDDFFSQAVDAVSTAHETEAERGLDAIENIAEKGFIALAAVIGVIALANAWGNK